MTPNCPRCNHLIQPDDSQDGLTYHCSACGAVLRLKAPLPGFQNGPASEEEEVTPVEEDDFARGILLEPEKEPETAFSIEEELATHEDDDQPSTPSELSIEEPAVEAEEDEFRLLDPDDAELSPTAESAATESVGESIEAAADDFGLSSVGEENRETIDFEAAAEEVREAADLDDGPSEASLHEEVSELLDKAKGIVGAGAGLAIGGMALAGGGDDEDEDQSPDDAAAGLADETNPVDATSDELTLGSFTDEPAVLDEADAPLSLADIEPAAEAEIELAADGLADSKDEASDELNLAASPPAASTTDEFSFLDEEEPVVESVEIEEVAGVEDVTEFSESAGISEEPFAASEPEEFSFDAPAEEADVPLVEASNEPLEFDIPAEDILDGSEIETVAELEEDTPNEIDFGLDAEVAAEEPAEIDFGTPVAAVDDGAESMDFGVEVDDVDGAEELTAEPEVKLPYGHPGTFLNEDAIEMESSGSDFTPAAETPSLEVPENDLGEITFDIDPPALDPPSVEPVEEDSLLDDLGAGLGAAAAGAAAMGAAAFASGDKEEEEVPEIVFDRVDDEVSDDISIDFEDAARPAFNPDEIEDDMELAPVDPSLADAAPAGVAATKPFEMVTPGDGKMSVAPVVPRKRNLAFDLVKLAVGGILGLGIAQGVLWWALKKDPLGLAPLMPPALAIAVPESLRNTLPPLKRRTTVPSARPQAESEVPDEPTRDFATDMSGGSGTTAQAEGSGARDADLAMDADGSGTRDADLSMDADGSGARDADLSMEGSGTTDAELVASMAPFAGLGLENGDSFSHYDVGAALASAKDSAAALDAANGGGKSELLNAARDFYTKLASLADQATLVTRGGDAESVLVEVRSFLNSVAANRNQVRFLGKGARSWIVHEKGRGVALAGTVQSQNAVGDLQEIQVQLDGTEQVVTVVTQGNESLGAGDRAVLFGVLVNDPSSNLKRYNGLDDQVIWATDLMTTN